MPNLLTALTTTSRPVFLFGSTPPREGTSIEKAKESCAKFAARSAVLATDGFIVYDIQDEGTRTTIERPFPFRKYMDPSLYGSFFPTVSGKECVIYKCVVEEGSEQFNAWIDKAIQEHGHHAFNLVGAASSTTTTHGLSLQSAGELALLRKDIKFGCVCIPERHTIKGNEDQNLIRKSKFGAEWFITQGIFDALPLIKLIHDYGALCKLHDMTPKKIILTFAPCGRSKTMTFIKWLGMQVPEEVEKRIFAADNPVQESVNILCELLKEVLLQTKNSGVPLGINVESLSIYKEEIDSAHELFQKLQAILLNSSGSPWAVRWFYVDEPLRRINSRAAHLPNANEVSVISRDSFQIPSTSDFAQIQEGNSARSVKEMEAEILESISAFSSVRLSARTDAVTSTTASYPSAGVAPGDISGSTHWGWTVVTATSLVLVGFAIGKYYR